MATMGEDIYRELRKAVDGHGYGFAASISGIELQLLRRLFTEEEAETYIRLTSDLETPEQVAARTDGDPERLAIVLEGMAAKGLVFPKRKGEAHYYAAAPFAHGLIEHQVERMDGGLARLIEDYMWAEKVPQEPSSGPEVETGLPLRAMPLRTVPIMAPVMAAKAVAPYEDVSEIIRAQDRIALANCYCAKQQEALESGCRQDLEVCLLLGFYADYYVEHGMGRKITQDEALTVLQRAAEAGLVHQIPDSEDPAAICNCCPDCCGQLRALKMLPNPAVLVTSDHFAEVDAELCNACELCVDGCSMDAISMSDDEIAAVNLEKCIGCGVCVVACPTDGILLASKPAEERQAPGFTTSFMRSSKDIESTAR